MAYLPHSETSVVVLRNTTGLDFSIDIVSRKLGVFAVVGSMAQIKAVRGADVKVTRVQVYQDADGAFETWTRKTD